MSDAADVERLEARLERERRARRQAEVIAERGMRELWETNRDLQERVVARTHQLERQLSALSLVHRHTVAELAAVVASIEDDVDRPAAAMSDEVVDRLRWLQRVAVVPPPPLPVETKLPMNAPVSPLNCLTAFELRDATYRCPSGPKRRLWGLLSPPLPPDTNCP